MTRTGRRGTGAAPRLSRRRVPAQRSGKRPNSRSRPTAPPAPTTTPVAGRGPTGYQRGGVGRVVRVVLGAAGLRRLQQHGASVLVVAAGWAAMEHPPNARRRPACRHTRAVFKGNRRGGERADTHPVARRRTLGLRHVQRPAARPRPRRRAGAATRAALAVAWQPYIAWPDISASTGKPILATVLGSPGHDPSSPSPAPPDSTRATAPST